MKDQRKIACDIHCLRDETSNVIKELTNTNTKMRYILCKYLSLYKAR